MENKYCKSDSPLLLTSPPGEEKPAIKTPQQ